MTYHNGSTSMKSSSRSLVVEEIRARGVREVVPEGDIDVLEKGLGVTINRSKNLTLTYGDIRHIAKDPIRSNKSTTFRMNCIVEKIPVPKINRVLGLSITPKSAINKEPVLTYVNNDGEEVEHPYNYIKSIGSTLSLKITGDLEAKYNLVVKDITNTKWYNWNTKQFQHGYNSKQDAVDLVSKQLTIPPQSSETKYHIFFDQKECGATSYSSDMPTEENPWVVYQLMKATTTFSFDDSDDRFIPGTTVSKTYNPGVTINAGSIYDGKIDFTITVLPKMRKIKLINEDLTRLRVDTKEIYSPTRGPDRTSILETDLLASVNSDYSIGTITGTITLHKSSIRDYNFNVSPTNFFKIA